MKKVIQIRGTIKELAKLQELLDASGYRQRYSKIRINHRSRARMIHLDTDNKYYAVTNVLTAPSLTFKVFMEVLGKRILSEKNIMNSIIMKCPEIAELSNKIKNSVAYCMLEYSKHVYTRDSNK